MPNALVMLRARQIAIGLVKDEIKLLGAKVAWYGRAQINKTAMLLVKSPEGQEIIAQAEREVLG